MTVYRSQWVRIDKEPAGFCLVLPYVNGGMTLSVRKTLREAYREANSYIAIMRNVRAL